MNYPLNLSFKLLAIFGQEIKVRDARDEIVCCVKQKAFRLREDVLVFADEAQTQQVCRIQADRVLDISAQYTITLPDGRIAGTLRREGMRSFWNATYHILDGQGNEVGLVHEENPWIKALDGLVRMVPIAGDIAAIFINPAYLVEMPAGQVLLRVQKRPSLLEHSFRIEQISPVSPEREALLIPSVMMMTLLERGRG